MPFVGSLTDDWSSSLSALRLWFLWANISQPESFSLLHFISFNVVHRSYLRNLYTPSIHFLLFSPLYSTHVYHLVYAAVLVLSFSRYLPHDRNIHVLKSNQCSRSAPFAKVRSKIMYIFFITTTVLFFVASFPSLSDMHSWSSVRWSQFLSCPVLVCSRVKQ